MTHIFRVIFLLSLTNAQLAARQSDIRETNFAASDSVAAKYYGHSLQNLPVLAHKLTHDLPDDAQKFRAIYKWVCDNIENDYQLFTDNQRNRTRLKDPVELRKWNTKMQSRMFETLLHRRSTICTGYAYLIKELCYFAGIKAEIVDGYGRNIASNIGGEGVINHSWTAVFLNGSWYLCDATWASGVIDLTTRQFVKRYDDVYFLSDPEYFIRNHFPIDKNWTLLKENPTLESFLTRPIIYSKAYKHKVLPHEPDDFFIYPKGNRVHVKVKADSLAGSQLSVLVNNQSPRVVVTKEIDGIYAIEFLSKRKNDFLLHVRVNNEVVLTYKVRR